MLQATPCPSCATPIPAVVAGAPFCPYCGERKPVALVVAQAASPRPAREPRPFSTSHRDLYLTFDPRAGFALLGVFQADGAPPRLRAFDVYNKRVAWEAFTGEPALEDLDYESIAVHVGNVYVGVGRSLRVLDLFTGQQKWGAELSDTLARDLGPPALRGARVIDPAPAGTRGPVWAVAIDDTIFAFDRDTGQPLWREVRERMPRLIRPYESGLLLLEHSSSVELVDPATKNVLDAIASGVERFDVEGRLGILQVENWGWRERDGILLHDFLARKEVLFEPVDSPEDDVPTVIGHGRVFCAVESGAKLFAGPQGRAIELCPGFHIRSLRMCGPTLFVLLSKRHGTSVRRVLGVDPQSLAVRFDLGEMTTEPNDDWTAQVCDNGQVAVLVTSPTGNDEQCELWGVDPSGRVLWRLPVGEWKAHYFLGGHVVVSSSMGWQIVRPDTGQVVAGYAASEDY
jgi:outer membrane protein assembly factor BamB